MRRVPIEGQADDFVADYEIVEDMPLPTLDDRKQALTAAIRGAETTALTKIISPARERLMGLDLNAVYAKPEAARSDADRALLARAAEVAVRKQAVQRHGAELEAAIEDSPLPPSRAGSRRGFRHDRALHPLHRRDCRTDSR